MVNLRASHTTEVAELTTQHLATLSSQKISIEARQSELIKQLEDRATSKIEGLKSQVSIVFIDLCILIIYRFTFNYS